MTLRNTWLPDLASPDDFLHVVRKSQRLTQCLVIDSNLHYVRDERKSVDMVGPSPLYPIVDMPQIP